MKLSLARDKLKRDRSYNGFNAGSAGGYLPTGPGALDYDDGLARDIQQFLKDKAYSVTFDRDSGHGS